MLNWAGSFMDSCQGVAGFFQDQLTLALDSPVIHVETVKVECNMSEKKKFYSRIFL